MGPPSRKLEICTPPCGVRERPELEERPTNDNIRQKPPGRNLPNWHKRFSCARSAQSSLFRVSVCGTIWREGGEEIEEEERRKKLPNHSDTTNRIRNVPEHTQRDIIIIIVRWHTALRVGGAGAGVGHNNARVSEPVDWNWHSCFGVYTGP